MDAIVRDATIDDLPRIVEIYNCSIPGRLATSDLEPVSIESRREWFLSHSPDKHPLWVCVIDGKIAAWIGLRAFYGRPAYHATKEISVYVAPEFQRRSLAPMLVTKMQEHCPALGVRTLLAFVFGHNDPSLRLFERAGFVKWGEFPTVAELDEVWRDLVILGWKSGEDSGVKIQESDRIQ